MKAVSDTQTVIREIPLPDESSFSPEPSAVVSSITPVFSWDPVSYDNVPLYYRFEVMDASGNIQRTPRTLGMTSFVLPQGYLLPGESYSWRVRVSDSGDWITVENRSHSHWQPFTMAATLSHPAPPALDLDTWGVVSYTTSNGTGFDLWVKVIDHDGVAFDPGSAWISHTVTVQPPVGGPIVLTYDYSETATAAYFSGYLDPAGQNLEDFQGDWTFTVEDCGGNTASMVDALTVAPLPVPDVATFVPPNGTTVADTTPTFSWECRYRHQRRERQTLPGAHFQRECDADDLARLCGQRNILHGAARGCWRPAPPTATASTPSMPTPASTTTMFRGHRPFQRTIRPSPQVRSRRIPMPSLTAPAFTPGAAAASAPP